MSYGLTIDEVRKVLNAEVFWCEDLSQRIDSIGAADLMSDVLALSHAGMLLLTGLISVQVVRTAIISDLCGVVFVRGKKPGKEILNLAAASRLPILSTPLTMFESAGRLYGALHRA